MLASVITAIATRTGFGRGVVTAGLVGLALALLLALAGLGAWRAAVTLQAVIDGAAQTARAERDAHWRAEIATANAAVERARVEQALAAVQVDTVLRASEAGFQTRLNDLETKNAALAGGNAVGLGRDRVRLLNGTR
jgi:hypothetical protein